MSRPNIAAVLDAMVANGAIDAPAASDAKAHPAVPMLTPRLAPARSWFTDWVRTQAPAVVGPHAADLRLRTTLMPGRWPYTAPEILDKALGAPGAAKLNISQGALVAMRPDDAVVAMVGGRDYGASQFNPRGCAQLAARLVKIQAVRVSSPRPCAPTIRPKTTRSMRARSIPKGWEPDVYGERALRTQ